MSSEGASNLAEMTSQLSLSDSTAATQTAPGVEGAPPTPGDHTHQTSHDSIPQDSEGENEDDSLGRSTGDEVGQLLRATVEELETALQVCVCIYIYTYLRPVKSHLIGVTHLRFTH